MKIMVEIILKKLNINKKNHYILNLYILSFKVKKINKNWKNILK